MTRVEQIGATTRGRFSYELDALDASLTPEDVPAAISDPNNVVPFAILRIVATPKSIFSNIGVELGVGDWCSLDIAPAGVASGPTVYHAQLQNDGYNVLSRGCLTEGRRLFSERGAGPSFFPLGASVVTADSDGRAIASACAFPQNAQSSDQEIVDLLSDIEAPTYVKVHDVGQASFCELQTSEREPTCYFDAGWPVIFNHQTEPKAFPLPRFDVPVILSHWDFDHLLCFYRYGMSRNKWVTPIQNLGPGARKIADRLAEKNRLFGWTGTSCHLPWGTIYQCTGHRFDSNDSGLALHVVMRSGRSVLLVGDANYSATPHTSAVDHLVVTHHGALFSGSVPVPTRSKSKCVISVGTGNVYKHPKEDAVLAHRKAGWAVSLTCRDRQDERGPRELGP